MCPVLSPLVVTGVDTKDGLGAAALCGLELKVVGCCSGCGVGAGL